MFILDGYKKPFMIEDFYFTIFIIALGVLLDFKYSYENRLIDADEVSFIDMITFTEIFDFDISKTTYNMCKLYGFIYLIEIPVVYLIFR